MPQLPAMSLAAVPGRRQKIIEIAQEVEKRGFPGIYGPSLGDSLSLCTAIAMVTSEIRLGTSITPIYTRNVTDFAGTVAFIANGVGLIPESIWFGRPWSHTGKTMLDALIYGLLAGGVFGWLA